MVICLIATFVSNESGRGNESMIDPTLPGTSSGSVGVSCRHARKSPAEIERDSCEESEETESCASEGNESKVKRIAHVGKHLSLPKLHKSPRNGEVLIATLPEEF